MKQSKMHTPSLKGMLAAAGLTLALVACGTPVTTNPPGNDDSSDGKVMVENKIYTETEARNGIQCYKTSDNEGVRAAATNFETTLNAALVLKSRGLNLQYETALSALIQSMVLFDRTSPKDCMN